MDLGLGIALLLVLAFAFTNGVHDASNAIATLVATRVARPTQALLLAAVFNTLGPLLVGAAVADTIGGIVAIDGKAAIAVIAAGLLAAVAWNVLTWWLGLRRARATRSWAAWSARRSSRAGPTRCNGAGWTACARSASSARRSRSRSRPCSARSPPWP